MYISWSSSVNIQLRSCRNTTYLADNSFQPISGLTANNRGDPLFDLVISPVTLSRNFGRNYKRYCFGTSNLAIPETKLYDFTSPSTDQFRLLWDPRRPNLTTPELFLCSYVKSAMHGCTAKVAIFWWTQGKSHCNCDSSKPWDGLKLVIGQISVVPPKEHTWTVLPQPFRSFIQWILFLTLTVPKKISS
jgi:hypothetical protein